MQNGVATSITRIGGVTTPPLNPGSGFREPFDAALSSDGATLYISDTYQSRIAALDTASGSFVHLAGSDEEEVEHADGVGTNALFGRPSGIAITSDDQFLFVVDKYFNVIRRIEVSTKTVTTFSGSSDDNSVDGKGCVFSHLFVNFDVLEIEPPGGHHNKYCPFLLTPLSHPPGSKLLSERLLELRCQPTTRSSSWASTTKRTTQPKYDKLR